jgi:mannose-6-phosphate isomerase
VTPTVHVLHNVVRNYAWGSRSAIAELLGAAMPSTEPQAELWIGAHRMCSSILADGTGRALADLIDARPIDELGTRVVGEFGPRLPFLLKIIAAEQPLSVQVHPSQAAAERGFANEEAAKIPLSHFQRNYRDRYSKPELLYALTEFHVLCGFRDPHVTVDILDLLAVDLLAPVRADLRRRPDERGIRSALVRILDLSPDQVSAATAAVLEAEQGRAGGEELAGTCSTIAALSRYHRTDPGVLVSLLMNRLVLWPGQALFTPTGQLHSYLSGTGVEIMGNSDNVLRCGLTPKHVDVSELLEVACFAPSRPDLVTAVGAGPEVDFPVPDPAFRLSRIDVDGTVPLQAWDGPQILLNLGDPLDVADGHRDRTKLERGAAMWVPAGSAALQLTGSGPVFRATDGLAR